MTTWPPRIREDQPDTSLKASIADLVEALNQARQERDQARAEIRKKDTRIALLWSHLMRARAMLAKSRRRQDKLMDERQRSLL